MKKLLLCLVVPVMFLIASMSSTKQTTAPEILVLPIVQKRVEQVKDERAERLDRYFRERSMPLAGYGEKLVQEADKNGIDWRLVAAIAVKESSGGKHVCGFNAWGWGSCKQSNFTSFSHGIEIVSLNLGGNNPRTASYYSGDTRSKLYYYNGTVEKEYPDLVLKIMEKF